MQRQRRLLDSSRITELLRALAGRTGLPLLLFDHDAQLLASHGTFCGEPACDTCHPCPAGATLESVPLPLPDQPTPARLAACLRNASEWPILQGAACGIEQAVRLELEIEDLSAEVVRTYQELALIRSLASQLGDALELETICQRVLEETARLLAPRNLAILLADETGTGFRVYHVIGADQDRLQWLRLSSNEGMLARALAKGEAITVCDIGANGGLNLPCPATSVLCAPLFADKQGVGIILACDKQSGEEFWSHELKLMDTLAAEAAAAIRKAQLYETVQTLFLHTVEALASAIDAKDPYTYGHSRRVARISVRIGQELGMSRTEARDVELAAILHDIGKIATPENILCKAGKLEPAEWQKIREHPTRGAQILNNIQELREIIEWIRHHHEWYNGTGYPDRMAAEAIPLQARIIAVADAFDAMTSDRPYRQGMPVDEALRLMTSETGRQFDPQVLAIFSRLVAGGEVDPR